MFAALIIFLGSCQEDLIDDGTNDGEKGTLKLEITDAPIDKVSVEGVFVTIASIALDGIEVNNFTKTTMDLNALQKGKTEQIFNQRINAQNYSSIDLVLDYETDENGNSPGCYVLKMDGTKDQISNEENTLTLGKDFLITENENTNLVVDFDLRKTIKEDNEDFELVSEANLEGGIRVVNRDESGVIQGNCNDLLAGADAVIVYAYKKGEFNRSLEIQGNQNTNLQFTNAVSSTMVDTNGNYELHFLEAGDYEIHFAAYERNSDGSLKLEGTLILELLEGLDLTTISVGASATVNVDVVATGILP